MYKKIALHEETGLGLPYPVTLKNAAEELIDGNGQRVGVRIPDLEGLAASIAAVRCLNPTQLDGREVRFVRRVLGLTQKQMADELEVSAVETISRWENNVDGAVGGYIEKLFRSLALIQLRERTPGVSLNHDAIVGLRIIKRDPEQWPVVEVELVKVPRDGGELLAWDLPRKAA